MRWLRGPLDGADARITVLVAGGDSPFDLVEPPGAPTGGAERVSYVVASEMSLMTGVRAMIRGVSLDGAAGPAIVDYVRRHPPDLLVIGSRGKGALASTLLGSVSSHAARVATCSVLIVRDARVPGLIVVGDDDSPDATAAIATLGRMEVRQAPLRLVHAVPPPPPVDQIPEPARYISPASGLATEALYNDAAITLERRRAGLLEQGWTDVEVSVRVGEPGTTLINAVSADDARLVAVGATGRGFKMFVGSVSDRVMLHAPCSVLIGRG